MSRARAIVSHAGAGTLLMALQYTKTKPFVVPRLAKFHEHVDNHQLFFSEYMHSRGLVVGNFTDNLLVHNLRTYLRNPPQQRGYRRGVHIEPLIHGLDSLIHNPKHD